MPVVRKKIGTWIEMDYDDEVTFGGVVWRRAQGGFGEDNKREDWVADIEGVSIHVARWLDESTWGVTSGNRLDTREDAMRAALDQGLLTARHKLAEAKELVTTMERCVAVLGGLPARRP